MDADSILHLAHPWDADTRLSTNSMLRYGPEIGVPRIIELCKRLVSIRDPLEQMLRPDQIKRATGKGDTQNVSDHEIDVVEVLRLGVPVCIVNVTRIAIQPSHLANGGPRNRPRDAPRTATRIQHAIGAPRLQKAKIVGRAINPRLALKAKRFLVTMEEVPMVEGRVGHRVSSLVGWARSDNPCDRLFADKIRHDGRGA
jgi:hypothetical protein